MSEYPCFNCNELTHVSELIEVRHRGFIGLLCRKCLDNIFCVSIEEELTKNKGNK
jgi:hypothetical protein